VPSKPLTTRGYTEDENKGASFETDWNALRITLHQFMKETNTIGNIETELMKISSITYLEGEVVEAKKGSISDVIKSLKKKEMRDWDRKSTTSDQLQILLDHGHQSKISLVKMLSRIAVKKNGKCSPERGREIVYAVVFITDMMAIRASKTKTECLGIVPTSSGGIEVFLSVLNSII